MKTALIFAAVLLSAVTAKMLPVSEGDKVVKVTTVQIPIHGVPAHTDDDDEVAPVVATVVEVTKDQAVVPAVHLKEPTPLVDLVKVPLMQSPQVPVTLVSTAGHEVKAPVAVSPVEKALAEATSKDCDLQCTKFDLNPVCAINDECLYEFPNQCVLETYNCVHPDKPFRETRDERCKMHWLERCSAEQMMSG